MRTAPHCSKDDDMGRGKQAPERMIDKALRSLRLQRIPVKQRAAGPGHYARLVDEVLLTDEEIVALYRDDRLTRWGLTEYVRATKGGRTR